MPRQLLAPFDDFRQAPVAQAQSVMNAAFAAKLELDRRPRHADVTATQRGKSERVILARVFFVADSNPADLEQSHDCGQDLFTRQPGQGQIAIDLTPNGRQLFAERQHPVVFGCVTNLAPALVIPMLLPASGISTGRLNVAVGQRTDPNVAPCGRNRKRADALELLGVADDLAGGVGINKTPAPASISWRIVRDVTETGCLGGLE